MFEKKIVFTAHEEYVKAKNIQPEPANLNIPEWYKKLEHQVLLKTIKGCMPFLDTLTTGYILKMPQDIYIEHNVVKDGERITELFPSVQEISDANNWTNININSTEMHPQSQLGKECPFNHKNKNLPFHKILNPWIIKTPPGYSCLFIPPMNNSDDRFSIIPGIVDTDSFPSQVNFPIIINGDKYPILTDVIKEGTPYVQIIPFKRDNRRFSQERYVIHNYKKYFWHKKSWK
jgi:hypothetical protein